MVGPPFLAYPPAGEPLAFPEGDLLPPRDRGFELGKHRDRGALRPCESIDRVLPARFTPFSVTKVVPKAAAAVVRSISSPNSWVRYFKGVMPPLCNYIHGLGNPRASKGA